MQVIQRGAQLVKSLMLAHLNLPFLRTDMSTGWSTHSNVLDPQQADTTKPTWMRALKQLRLSFSSMVYLFLKKVNHLPPS